MPPKEERIERPSAPLLEKDPVHRGAVASVSGPGTPRLSKATMPEASDKLIRDDMPEMIESDDDMPYHLPGDPESEDDDDEEDAGAREPTRKRMRETATILEQLNALLKTSEVGRIVKELNKSPEFQMPKNRRLRKRLTQDGWMTDCGEVCSPPRWVSNLRGH